MGPPGEAGGHVCKGWDPPTNQERYQGSPPPINQGRGSWLGLSGGWLEGRGLLRRGGGDGDGGSGGVRLSES
eukprot:CAMPEP_0174731158 /NCGR_PEP_ID=MMETSP1094-20130205/57000_1 /TAXON_ID=156173 /ORGANISM="Chrysochromulina brevifilum, Strain UTEX LB 985" /LENGTH=71 /DNA_ID=CAMNT_0015933507 /DNA_START=468 /DNA_END=683 /DNA_ORIENTATION=+